SLYPGYKAPSVFRNGRFFYHAEPHAGARVEGRIVRLAVDDPEQALAHYAYAGVGQWVQKANRYTDAEAAALARRGAAWDWRKAVAALVRDFQAYYDGCRGAQDGPPGFHWAFLGGVYRFLQHAKL